MLLPLHHQGSPLKKWRDNYSLRLEESIGKSGFDINHSKFPLDPALRIKKNRNKKNSARDLINLESTYTEKENITKENDNPQSGKKVGKKIYQQVIHLQNKQTAHAAQNTLTHSHTHTHTHTHTPEMGQRSKWIFLQRMYPDRYKAREKMLRVPNDWRNANQNDNEVSAKITESEDPPKDLQRLNSARSRGKRNHSTLGAGM